MSIQRCPHCGTPLLDEEALGPACPMCGGAMEAPAPPPPSAAPAPPPVRRPWGLMALSAGLAAVVLWQWLTRPLPSLPPPVEESPAYLALMEQKKRADTDAREAPKRAMRRAAEAKKQLAAKESELEAEHEKRTTAEQKLTEALARATAAEKRVAEVEEDLKNTVRLDKPSSIHRIETIRDGEVVRLAGRIGSLRIGSVDGKGVLDARNLVARNIIVERGINGKSRVLLHAPRGAVTVMGVEGGSELEIDAPAGRVVVRSVNGESRVKIRARETMFIGPINGKKTKVAVTITRKGGLNFTEVTGGSRLSWKKEDATDPMPRIGKGVVRAPAEFVEGD